MMRNKSRKDRQLFSITNAKEFFSKVKDDLATLEEKIDDSGRAMNCILSSYHLHEWVWAHELKARSPMSLGNVVVNNKASFVCWLQEHCPYFLTLQELANGTKHCAPVHSTRTIAGHGTGPFGIGPYGESYLLIDLGEHICGAQRWLVTTEMLREIVAFWTSFFAQHTQPDAKGPSINNSGSSPPTRWIFRFG